jgi:hypothetical protein
LIHHRKIKLQIPSKEIKTFSCYFLFKKLIKRERSKQAIETDSNN